MTMEGIEAKIRKSFGSYIEELWMEEASDCILWTRFSINPNMRGCGIGSKIMEMLCAYADRNGLDIFYTPSDCYGEDMFTLICFYTKHGFVKNDDEMGDEMVRHPK